MNTWLALRPLWWVWPYYLGSQFECVTKCVTGNDSVASLLNILECNITEGRHKKLKCTVSQVKQCPGTNTLLRPYLIVSHTLYLRSTNYEICAIWIRKEWLALQLQWWLLNYGTYYYLYLSICEFLFLNLQFDVVLEARLQVDRRLKVHLSCGTESHSEWILDDLDFRKHVLV